MRLARWLCRYRAQLESDLGTEIRLAHIGQAIESPRRDCFESPPCSARRSSGKTCAGLILGCCNLFRDPLSLGAIHADQRSDKSARATYWMEGRDSRAASPAPGDRGSCRGLILGVHSARLGSRRTSWRYGCSPSQCSLFSRRLLAQALKQLAPQVRPNSPTPLFRSSQPRRC